MKETEKCLFLYVKGCKCLGMESVTLFFYTMHTIEVYHVCP
jgi:hypothetical protein